MIETDPDHEPTIAEQLALFFPPLAAHLDVPGLAALAAVLYRIVARSGDEVHRRGQRVPELLFLMRGRFALRLGDEQAPAELGYLPEHTIVGEVSFFDGGPATATIVACDPRNVILTLDERAYDALAAANPAAAAGLCRAICDVLAARLRDGGRRFDRVIETRGGERGMFDALQSLFGLGRRAS